MKTMFYRSAQELQETFTAGHEKHSIEETTRCVCGSQSIQTEDHGYGNLYIQCDQCLVWQHRFCVGFTNEKKIPEIYYCEICRPDLHHTKYKSKESLLAKYQPSTKHIESISEWRSIPLKRKWIVQSKDAENEIQLEPFMGKIMKKALSEPITSNEKGKESLSKGKRRRNSDLPELSINYKTKRIRALSVSPRMSLSTQCNDSEEEHTGAFVKKRKKVLNIGNEIRKNPTKGRQAENKNKTRTNEKKTKNVSDDNSDVTTNSSKSKQLLKTNSQNNTNQPIYLEQKFRTKTKSKKMSMTRHQHDTRQAQLQKDSEEHIFPTISNIIDKPSRPRIPQAKITMTEMKKRVAAILEYIGRTQLEMASDEEHRKKLFVPLLEKIDKGLKENVLEQSDKKKLDYSDSDKNSVVEASLDAKMINNGILHYNFESLEMMDNLTKQLLEWEEKFGSYNEKNS